MRLLLGKKRSKERREESGRARCVAVGEALRDLPRAWSEKRRGERGTATSLGRHGIITSASSGRKMASIMSEPGSPTATSAQAQISSSSRSGMPLHVAWGMIKIRAAGRKEVGPE